MEGTLHQSKCLAVAIYDTWDYTKNISNVFHQVNSRANVGQFWGNCYIGLAGASHHQQFFSVTIQDTWNYAEHLPVGFQRLTHKLI